MERIRDQKSLEKRKERLRESNFQNEGRKEIIKANILDDKMTKINRPYSYLRRYQLITLKLCFRSENCNVSHQRVTKAANLKTVPKVEKSCL